MLFIKIHIVSVVEHHDKGLPLYQRKGKLSDVYNQTTICIGSLQDPFLFLILYKLYNIIYILLAKQQNLES